MIKADDIKPDAVFLCTKDKLGVCSIGAAKGKGYRLVKGQEYYRTKVNSVIFLHNAKEPMVGYKPWFSEQEFAALEKECLKEVKRVLV